MATEKLNEQELKETNGGSILGGNDSTNSSTSSLGLNVDNLISGSNSSTDGDQSNSSSYSIGNGIGAALGKGNTSSQS